MKRVLLLVVVLFLFASCSKKVVKFSIPQNEVFMSDSLKILLKENRTISIMLRSRATPEKVTDQASYNIYYSAIENQFVNAGYNVRDRGLFNEITSTNRAVDYSKFKELTNTDLILELIDVNTHVKYTTNEVTKLKKSGKNKIKIVRTPYQAKGASVQFRLILVRNNQIVGNFKYNSEPKCPASGCPVGVFNHVYQKEVLQYIVLNETIKPNYYEEFIKDAAYELIKTLAK